MNPEQNKIRLKLIDEFFKSPLKSFDYTQENFKSLKSYDYNSANRFFC